MSDTSVSTAPSPPPAPTLSPAAPAVLPATAPPRPRPRVTLRRALKGIASLRLTVVLFVLSLVLVFFGTLAQTESGLNTVISGYFRSWGLVWVPFQLLIKFGQVFLGLPTSWRVGGSFPFPAGYTLGALLLVNLLAAHATRFQLSWKRTGIWMIHAGLIVMMLGELVTGVFAVESKMTLATGETVDFVDVSPSSPLIDPVELAVRTPNADDPEKEDVVAVPAGRLRRHKLVQDDKLPFDVRLDEYLRNSALVPARETTQEPFDQRDTLAGVKYALLRRGEETGVDPNAREDAATARVTFLRKGTDEVLASYVLSLWYYPNYIRRAILFEPRTVGVDGKVYTVELRMRREYKPYRIRLDEFTHDLYVGTDTAKDFASRVVLTGDQGDRREVRISMNDPMRYRGETFYQSGWLDGDKGTILQVVDNPGWLMPYFSCVLVALGMIVHFTMNLAKFLNRRVA